jgi:hypothetical protein
MATDLPYAAYGAIGAEPWLYPYSRKDHYQTQLPHNGELRGALATPLVLGPGWYKGFRVHFDPSAITTYDTRKPMRSYGYIANLPGPRRGVYPVRDPVGGFRRPAGPVKPVAYIPSGLPIIRPGPGWHIGPSVYSNLSVGTVYGGPEEVPAAEKPALEALRNAIYGEMGFGVGVGILAGLIGYVGSAHVFNASERTAQNVMIAGFSAGTAYAAWQTYTLLSNYKKGA